MDSPEQEKELAKTWIVKTICHGNFHEEAKEFPTPVGRNHVKGQMEDDPSVRLVAIFTPTPK